MQHHVGVGMVHGVSKGHRAAALILVHVKEFAGKGVLHETLEGLHHFGYQLVQCEQYIAVGACTHHRNQSPNQCIKYLVNHSFSETGTVVGACTHAPVTQSACAVSAWPPHSKTRTQMQGANKLGNGMLVHEKYACCAEHVS